MSVGIPLFPLRGVDPSSFAARSYRVSISPTTLCSPGETSLTRTRKSRVSVSTTTKSPSTSLLVLSPSTIETVSTGLTSIRTVPRTSPIERTRPRRTLRSREHTPTTRHLSAAFRTECWDLNSTTTTVRLRCSTTRCLTSRRSILLYVLSPNYR